MPPPGPGETPNSEATRFLTALLDAAPLPILLAASDGTLLRVNKRAEELLCWPREALMGRSLQSLKHPDDLESDTESRKALLAGKVREVQAETRIARSDGSYLWIRLTATVAADVLTGGPLTVAMLEDITQARADREALERKTELLESVLHDMEDAVLVTDVRGQVIECNQAHRRVFGEPEGAEASPGARETGMEGPSYGLFVSGQPTPLLPEQQPLARAMGGERVRDAELLVRTPSRPQGGWYSINASPLFDRAGRIRGGLMVARDVTEAKELRQALERSERLYRSMAGNLTNSAVFMFDLDLRFLLADGPLLETLGLTKQAIEGHLLSEVGAPENAQFMEASYRRALAGEGTDSELVRHGRTVELHVTPVRDDQGAVVAGMVMAYDITEIKEAQLRLARRGAALELLQRITSASNRSADLPSAIRAALAAICDHTGWTIGHCYLREGEALVSTRLWHGMLGPTEQPFREASEGQVVGTGEGLVGRVLESGRVNWIHDLAHHPSFLRRAEAELAGLTCALALPLLIDTEVAGVLEVFSRDPLEPDHTTADLMQNVGSQLGRVVERERARASEARQAERIRELALIDELTGLRNRRGFLELGRRDLDRLRRNQEPAVLFFFDLNRMKSINDRFGHEMGDRALKELAFVLRQTFRFTDLLARLGGDEFVALAPEADESHAEPIERRLQAHVAELNKNGGRPYELSVSIGRVAFDPGAPFELADLMAVADARMYDQKRQRRASLNGPPLPNEDPSESPSAHQPN